MRFNYSKKLSLKFISAVLVVCLAVPASLAAFPKKAEAGASSCLPAFLSGLLKDKASKASGLAAVPTFPITSTYNEGVTSGRAESSFLKDCVEHTLALAVAKFMLARMTEEIVSWINGGFSGSPQFLTNPGNFFLNVGDQIAGEFILGSNLAFLCSPFKLQIQLALALNYSYSAPSKYKAACTLSGVIGNVDNAIEDFSNDFAGKGGWSSWLSISQNPNNNVYGSYLSASAAMETNINEKVSQKHEELSWGGGFFSNIECTNLDGKKSKYDVSDTRVQGSSNCKIVTPGSTISGVLQGTLNVPADQLGLADDLDKIFNALTNQIIMQVFNKGLAAVSSSDSSDSQGRSALQQLSDTASSTASRAYTDANTDVNKLNDAGNNALDQGTQSDQPTTEMNVAMQNNALATQSSIDNGHEPQNLNDGTTKSSMGIDNDYTGAQTKSEPNPWMMINLRKSISIARIIIFQRTNPKSGVSTQIPFTVQVLDGSSQIIWESQQYTQNFSGPIEVPVPVGVSGQYVKVVGHPTTSGRLEIAEIEVYNNTPAKITLKGSNPYSVAPGATFIDPGATAVDARDGDISASVTIAGTVDASKAGSYTLTYSVTNTSGLTSTATRTVTVQADMKYAPNYGPMPQ